jgi:oxygen-independent coproporphyrinogen-3 oxidase
MHTACQLKVNCPRWRPATPAALAAKYDARVPRYTSYPTAPHFHAGVGERDYRAWLAAIEPKRPVSLYLHIPFCAQLCWYCGCHTSVAGRRAPIADYVDALVDELELVAEAIGRRLPVASVHLGGGTPNSLDPRDVDRIFEALGRAFAINNDAEIATEIDPRALTRRWVEAAARNGLRRASLGVQDIDPTVQKAINRRQPWAVTVRAVDALRDAGVASINLDLMYGLPHQTVATIEETIAQVLKVEPDRIALFGYAHVPWMKRAQKLIPQDALPDVEERYRQQARAAELLSRAGYVSVGLDHFARANDPLARALAVGTVHRNFQGYTTDDADTLIGFGASSIGRQRGGYVQNFAKTLEWRNAVAAGRLPIARGAALTDDDRLRGEIIERLMCDFRVDLDAFADRPGFDPGGFTAEFRKLTPFETDGLVARDRRTLIVTDRGRPFVRAICAVFDRYLVASAERHSRGI